MFTAQEYARPATLEEAYALNQRRGNTIIGGGGWLRMGRQRFHTLIDLSGLGLDNIKEEDGRFTLGAMVTLRQMELDRGLAGAFGPLFADMAKHIVGIQFRNRATLGGSLAARFGFSDVLTCLLALDCEVELAGAGTVPLPRYAQMPYDRDVLARVILHKNGRRAAYESTLITHTDIPVLTCAASALGDSLRVVIGARPGRASALDGLSLADGPERAAQAAREYFSFGSNMRASAQYRRHLAGVLAARAVRRLQEVNP